MNIEKHSVTLESDIIMANTTAVMNLIVKVPSVYYMIRLRNYLAFFGKNINKSILVLTTITILMALPKETSQ